MSISQRIQRLLWGSSPPGRFGVSAHPPVRRPAHYFHKLVRLGGPFCRDGQKLHALEQRMRGILRLFEQRRLNCIPGLSRQSTVFALSRRTCAPSFFIAELRSKVYTSHTPVCRLRYEALIKQSHVYDLTRKLDSTGLKVTVGVPRWGSSCKWSAGS